MNGPRLELAAAYIAAAALVVIVLAVVIYRMGSSAIDRRAEAEVAENANWTLGQLRATGEAEAGNTWVVNPDDEWSDPLADTWVEPPLFTLAAEGRWGPTYLRFEQDATDGPWLGYAVPVGEESGTVLVTAIDLATYRGGRSTLLRTLGVGLVVGLGPSSRSGGGLGDGRWSPPRRRSSANATSSPTRPTSSAHRWPSSRPRPATP